MIIYAPLYMQRRIRNIRNNHAFIDETIGYLANLAPYSSPNGCLLALPTILFGLSAR